MALVLSRPSLSRSTDHRDRNLHSLSHRFQSLITFMGLNILFWNCQGIRPKRKELELYLKENEIDVIALNETFLNKKLNFRISSYDTIRNDRPTGQRGGVAFLVKHDLVISKEYRNSDFNIITENEALTINLELTNNQNLTLAIIYCPNGNPNFSIFQSINNLSADVMFIGDFISKLESFGCAHKSPSGPMLKNIQKQLNLIYLNNDEHMHMDRAEDRTDILDMAFISGVIAVDPPLYSSFLRRYCLSTEDVLFLS